MNFVISGGHLTPALAFAQTALAHHDSVAIIGTSNPSGVEAQEFAALKLQYYQITQVKYDRFHKLSSLLKSPRILQAVRQAYRHLNRLKPDRVVVFGSFNALPVAIAARWLHIPCYLHEQTRIVGLANRLISWFASGCAYSYPESASRFRCNNLLFTGNLIRSLFWTDSTQPDLPIKSDQPVIFVTGGNQGSKILIDLCINLALTLQQKYQLVLQTGNHPISSNQLLTKSWFSAQEMSWLLHHAHIIICRGGANTLAEIMIAGTPAIIVPLPISSGDEQTANATLIHKNQAGILLPQSKLNSNSLIQAIRTIETNYSTFKQAASKLKQYQNPAANQLFYDFVVCQS